MKSDRLQILDMLLTGNYDISTPGEFTIGQAFGLNKIKKILGLRIADENELNASSNLQGGATLMPYSVLSDFCISIYNPAVGDWTLNNLPLTALVINGSTEIKAGPYYDISQPVDWTKCKINVCNPPAALPAGQYYVLSIQAYFQL